MCGVPRQKGLRPPQPFTRGASTPIYLGYCASTPIFVWRKVSMVEKKNHRDDTQIIRLGNTVLTCSRPGTTINLDEKTRWKGIIFYQQDVLF